MTTFPPLSLVQTGTPATPRKMWLLLRKVMFPGALSLAPLAGLVGLAGQTGLMDPHMMNLGYGLCALLTSGILALFLWRLDALAGSSHLPRSGVTSPVVETLTSVEAFVDRLEHLSHQSMNIFVLDLTNMSRFLAAAPRFLSFRCAPRRHYRQVSNIAGEKGFQDLVRLIRRGAPAERGTYFCLREGSCLCAGSSFCLVEREDGLYVFLVHKLSDRGTAEVVLVHDETFGRLILRQFARLWVKLDGNQTPLFRNGSFDRTEESKMIKNRGQSRASRSLRAA